MNLDVQLYLEQRRRFLENRLQFPVDALAQYAGEWIAWSPDGTRVVAHTTEPEKLEDLVRAAGLNPVECVQQGIPEFDSGVGGGLGTERP